MKPLSSNTELYEYLTRLEAGLRSNGRLDLADEVAAAIHQASGMSTEFLGEARIILRRILKSGQHALTEQELRDLRNVLDQLDSALDKR